MRHDFDASRSVTEHRIGSVGMEFARALVVIKVTRTVKGRGWTEEQAAGVRGIGSAAVSTLVRGRHDDFSIEILKAV